MGCDYYDTEQDEVFYNISIHAPTWGATRHLCQPITLALSISIHAPTWGATYTPKVERPIGEISIHAPTWGATRYA